MDDVKAPKNEAEAQLIIICYAVSHNKSKTRMSKGWFLSSYVALITSTSILVELNLLFYALNMG